MDGIIAFCQLSSHVRPDLTEITTSLSASARPYRPLIRPRRSRNDPTTAGVKPRSYSRTVLRCEIALEQRTAGQIKKRPCANILVLITTVIGI